MFFQNSELGAAASDKNTENAPTIYAVEITGNRITSSELILREMKLKPGLIATPEALALDQKNIESLGLFNRVELLLVSDAGRAVLQVEVSEPFYIYPFIFGDYNPNDPDHNFYGAGAYHTNIMGMGIRLSVFIWEGYRRGVFVNYDDLWYSFNGKYGLKGSVYLADNEVTDPQRRNVSHEYHGKEYLPECFYLRTLPKDVYFRAYTQRYMLGLRRRLGHARQSLHFETLWEVTECESDSYTHTAGSIDRIASVRVIIENDLRNYKYYPSSGIYTLLEVSGNQIVDISHNFLFERIDLRGYKEINNVIFAGKIWGLATHNTLPFHKRLIVPRKLMRAGKTNEYPTGTVLGLNLETRFNLLKKRYYSLAKLPLIGAYLRNLGVSLEGVVFVDTGFHVTAESGFDENLLAWGGGFQMQVPFVKTVHLLFGWTSGAKLDQPSITFNTGVTF